MYTNFTWRITYGGVRFCCPSKNMKNLDFQKKNVLNNS